MFEVVTHDTSDPAALAIIAALLWAAYGIDRLAARARAARAARKGGQL